jgi:hypothetical protein
MPSSALAAVAKPMIHARVTAPIFLEVEKAINIGQHKVLTSPRQLIRDPL